MAEIPDALGVYAVIRYQGASDKAYPEETWQFGLRIAWSNGDEPYPTGEGLITLDPKTVADASVNRELTDYNVQQGWTGVGVGNVPTDADQDAIAEALGTWATESKPQLANQFVFESIRLYPFLQNGRSATAPSIYTSKSVVLNPTGTNALPPDVAFCVSLYTATRGPKGRGRFYMGGLSNTLMSGSGLVSGPQVDFAGTYATNLITNLRRGSLAGLSYTPVIWHRLTDTASVIQRVRIDNHFDTQRRRDRQVTPVWKDFPLT